MSTLQAYSYDSTSAAGAMLAPKLSDVIVVGLIMAGLNIPTMASASPTAIPAARATVQTTAGASVPIPDTTTASIAELRKLSGLTWDQLARLFDVSRRSVHFWASGKAMTSSNEERLHRTLGVIRKIDRGSATANRNALLANAADGNVPFDLLASGQYDRVFELLGAGSAPRARSAKPSLEAVAARAPRPPGELAEALHDRVSPASGRLLAAKPVRVPRRK